MTDPFDAWLAALEAQHLADLRFTEVSRALRAVSATYVERRQRLAEGAVLAGAGKRAAFSLFYGPLHYLTVREIVRALGADTAQTRPSTIVDLGCGTGVGGAAWAAACSPKPRLLGVDRHPWAAAEAARTYRHFGLSARAVTGDLATAVLPTGRIGVIAAFALNELPEASRDALVPRLVERARAGGGQLLVVEPLAGFVAPWWRRWRAVVEDAGGRADEWRFRLPLPPIVAKLDRAVGLDHRELTARSLAIGFAEPTPASPVGR